MTSIPAPTNNLQDVPPTSLPADVSDPRPDDQPRPNKFKYEEFAGPAGERYLFSLAEQFAPFSLRRTWYASVSYQAPGNACYVGVKRLVERQRLPNDGIGVGVRERKVYLDFDALEERGWLTQKRVRMSYVDEDGKTVHYAATVKDFSGFYDTAHDYHLWINSPEYIAPERENVPLILAEPGLAHRLIRFENYRRLLVHRKPGPKSLEKPDFYACQLEALAAQAEEREQASTPVQEVNIQLNTPAIIPSPYRITENRVNNNIHTSSFSIAEGDAATIGNGVTLNTGGTTPSKLNSPSSPQREGRGAARAEEVLGYTDSELKYDKDKRGAAAINIPADQLRKLQGGLDQAEEEERRQREQEREAEEEEGRPKYKVPDSVIQAAEEYTRLYDDPQKIHGSITRFKKIYATATEVYPGFDVTAFLGALDQAKRAAAKYASERRNSKGKVNRVPYLLTCMENALFTLEELVYLREDDPLYLDYGLFDVIENLHRSYEKEKAIYGANCLEYRDWLNNIIDQKEPPREKPKKRELNPTSRDNRWS